MKLYLFFCALISAIALINGYSIESNGIELLNGEFFNNDDHGMTDEQMKCIVDGINKINEDNPNLKPWFEDIARTYNTLKKILEKCHALNGTAKKKCFEFLDRLTNEQYNRLFGNLTDQQKKVLEDTEELKKKCLKEETTLDETKFPFDSFLRSFEQKDGVRINYDQKKCIEDRYLKVKADNPDLQTWFNDIEPASIRMTEESKECKKLDEVEKVECLLRLAENAQKEFIPLLRDVSEEQQQALEQLKNVIVECLQGAENLKNNDNDKSAMNVEKFLEIRFNIFPNNTAITEEQINCIKEVYIKIINENPELQAWIEEVEATSKKLQQSAQECKAQSGLDQLKCYVKLINTARQEIIRLANLLSEVQKEILSELLDGIKECLSNEHA